MSQRRPWTVLGLAVLASLPCLAVIVCIHRYAGFLPLEDQWDTPGRLLEAQLDGSLTWRDFFVQHNEARKAFTNVVWMLLATSEWSARLEMYTSVLLVGACVLFYLWICRRASPGTSLAPLLLATTASVLLFNPAGLTGAQIPWLWGVNLENAIVIVVLVGAIFANTHLRSWPLRFATSAACSVAATYSFANGMLLWVLLYPRWLGPYSVGPHSVDVGSVGAGGLKTWAPTRRSLWLDVAYLAAFATVVVTYFSGYFRPPSHPSLMEALGRPDRVVKFYFAWLGAPLSPKFNSLAVAALVGFIGVGLFLWSFVQVARHRLWVRALPFLLLAAYTLISATAVSLGRSGAGAGGALASRYYLHVLVFYLGLNGLLWLCTTVGRERGRGNLPRFAFWTVLALQVACVASNWVGIHPKHIRFVQERVARGEAALQFVDLVPDNPDLTNIHGRMPQLIPRFKLLTRAGVLDIELAPSREKLEVSSAVVDQSATLFLTSLRDELRIFGDVVDGPATEVLSHLLIHARAGAEEKYVSVIPLAAYRRERGTGRFHVDALISQENLPGGLVALELFGYDPATRRCVSLGVTTELRTAGITPAEILDATDLELRPQVGLVALDMVNDVAVLGRPEVAIPRGGPLVFSGWAVDVVASQLAARVYVKVGERLFPAQYGQPRPDVARNLDRPDFLACGFTCALDESLLDAETSGLFNFVVETRRGEFLVDPQGLTIQRVDR
jgi:hypothetical protein